MTRIGRPGWDVALPTLHTLARVLAMFAAMFADVRVLADVRAAPRPGVRDAHRRRARDAPRRRSSGRFAPPSRPSNNAVPYRRRVPLIDYYAVLDVPPESSSDEIRAAWRALQKSVHPDLAGDHAAAAAALVNEAFEILTSPSHRASFDADRDEWLAHGANDDLALVDPTPLSAWSGPDPREPADARGRHDAAFVDESRCVGCLQCALHAPETFHVETRFGKARVVNQWADGRDAVEDAVDACPVRCIHFVDRVAELPLLERVAARLWKEGGAAFGGPASSPFEVAESLRRRAAGPGGIAPWPSRRRRGGSNGRPNGGGARRFSRGLVRGERRRRRRRRGGGGSGGGGTAADAWAETKRPTETAAPRGQPRRRDRPPDESRPCRRHRRSVGRRLPRKKVRSNVRERRRRLFDGEGGPGVPFAGRGEGTIPPRREPERCRLGGRRNRGGVLDPDSRVRARGVVVVRGERRRRVRANRVDTKHPKITREARRVIRRVTTALHEARILATRRRPRSV